MDAHPPGGGARPHLRAASARMRRARRAPRPHRRARSLRPTSRYRRPASTLFDLQGPPSASMPQTHREAGSRQDALPRLRPLDERDRPLEVRLEVSPLRRRDAVEPVEIEMRDLDTVPVVAVADRVGGTRDALENAERAARAADEGRLARAEFAGDGDDVAGRKPPGELRGQRLRL